MPYSARSEDCRHKSLDWVSICTGAGRCRTVLPTVCARIGLHKTYNVRIAANEFPEIVDAVDPNRDGYIEFKQFIKVGSDSG
eukprot:SAG11_NODE_65_length_18798_cov_11.881224_8_plen_82_part_00